MRRRASFPDGGVARGISSWCTTTTRSLVQCTFELDPVRLQLERAKKGGKGIFRALARRAPMTDEQRPCARRHSAMRSTIIAMPWPTPMHIVARP